VLIAAVILVVGLTTMLGLLDSSIKATATAGAREGATNLARAILEDARTIPYAQLSNPDVAQSATITAQLQAMNGLADASAAAGWQIVRRGITYTVTATECSIDDPKDGYGAHDSTFCADSNKTAAEDSQPADLKRVTVDVKWTAIGRSPDVRQVLTLTSAGEAVGLSASSLKLSSPVVGASSAPLITAANEPASKELTFSVSSPTGTSAMTWSLDGNRQTPAPAFQAGTTWTFKWAIGGLSDGTYKVSAQAINKAGVTGPPVSIAVTLIRGAPAAPKGTKGGFNTINVSGTPAPVAELEWQPNSERNVIGYRVYNRNKLICANESASASTSCIDKGPPARSASAEERSYKISALYRKAEGEVLSNTISEGPAASFTITGEPPVLPGPEAPVAPLKAVREGEVVKLSWSAPTTKPSFYRIYRGTTDYTSRYDVTGSGEVTTYEDVHAIGFQKYWVTSVNSSLKESSFLGPVEL
jgi:Tfp pilus assembly protein PilV